MADPELGFWGAVARALHGRQDLGPADFATLRRRPSGNDALIRPPDFCPAAADADAPVFALAPSELDARLRAMALADTDVTELADSRPLHRRFAQHTRLMRYPDVVDAVVLPAEGGATLALWSRSLVGRKDFGVNRARLKRWISALTAAQS